MKAIESVKVAKAMEKRAYFKLLKAIKKQLMVDGVEIAKGNKFLIEDEIRHLNKGKNSEKYYRVGKFGPFEGADRGYVPNIKYQMKRKDFNELLLRGKMPGIMLLPKDRKAIRNAHVKELRSIRNYKKDLGTRIGWMGSKDGEDMVVRQAVRRVSAKDPVSAAKNPGSTPVRELILGFADHMINKKKSKALAEFRAKGGIGVPMDDVGGGVGDGVNGVHKAVRELMHRFYGADSPYTKDMERYLKIREREARKKKLLNKAYGFEVGYGEEPRSVGEAGMQFISEVVGSKKLTESMKRMRAKMDRYKKYKELSKVE